jgi:hypothetical protein
MHEELPFEEVAQPVRMSYLEFLFQSLGYRYALLLPAAAALAFVVVLILLLRGRGPAMVGAMLFVVPLPIFVGILGVVDGMLASFHVVAMSNTAPKPAEYAQGISMSLVSLWVGLLLAVPSFLLAAIGLIGQALAAGRPSDPPLATKLK